MRDGDNGDGKRTAKVVVASLAVGAAFLVIVLATGYWIAERTSEPTGRWFTTLVGIALACVAVGALGMLGSMDELQRKMHSEAMDFAFRCSVLIVAADVYAQAAGLPVPPLHWVLIAMMACWSVGIVMAFRRYR